MSVVRLIVREMWRRKLNALLGLVSVVVAIACLVGAATILRAGDLRTEQILKEKEAEVEAAGRELQEAMRRATLKLGFNLLIIPKDQDLNELHVKGTLSKYMPEEYAERLTKASVVSINHVLPILTEKIRWPERGLEVILIGTRGEVPLAGRPPKKPLLDAVPPGSMVVGFHVAKELGLKEGQRVTLLGQQFKIKKVHEERGTADDSTLWINLAEAQELLGKQNLINAILALECRCAWANVTKVRQELATVLPGTQVIERGPKALARAEARKKAEEEAQAALERERRAREQLRTQRRRVAAVLVPLVLIGSAVWIALLMFGNVRERRVEIGILRAIGLRSLHILAVFLGKALLIGFVGSLLGYVAGFLLGAAIGDLGLSTESLRFLFAPTLLFLSLVLALLLSALASWLPSLLAAQQDPAVILAAE